VSLTFIPVSPYVDTGGAGAASGAGSACAARAPGPLHGTSLLVTILLACMGVSLFVSALIWGRGIRSFSPTFFRRRGKRAAPDTGRENGRNAADRKDKP
jgi:type III secretion protein J